ncbi:hypothetical protein [Bacillus sp. FJAT-27245]|uniref:hypothetical protein n=1 Tax=Bacillus sp. FJAT-27245 TaxID=1684144 RepID=UPI0006A7822C|nr:hypothetical protein [Bacillus sp. FJAT-27245]
MKLKSFLVSFAAFVGTAGILYAIGHIFSIPLLMFRHEFTSDSDGFFMNIGSLLPIVIGLATSFVAEKYYLSKVKKNLG